MIRPLSDRIVVRLPKQGEKTLASGIVIPDAVNSKEKPTQAEVIAIGPGRTENGIQIPIDVNVGDQVLFSKFSGIPLEVEDEEVLVLTERDLLAVVSKGEK